MRIPPALTMMLLAWPLQALATEPWIDVSNTHLPGGVLNGRDMDAWPVDIDFDGDLDLVIAREFGRNILLLGTPDGHFTNSATAFPNVIRDSEDIAIGDFDDDGDLDVVFVSEDDQVNEFYLNNGTGLFTAAPVQLPVTGVSNAVVVAHLNGDTVPDLIIGNAGQNRALLNDGTGVFTDVTGAHLPIRSDITQDLELGDVDGDGDDDLIVGNEDDNALLINDGNAVFTDETEERLPLTPNEETREADFGDVDGDGDLDLLFANVELHPPSNRQNRLLLNDGKGCFTDVTLTQLPADDVSSIDGDFVDLDGDGDLDIVLANFFGGGFLVYANDGSGVFTDETAAFLPASAVGSGMDIEATDLNGDDRVDLFLTSYLSTDILLFAPVKCAEDFDANGAINFADLNALLAAWGPCGECPEDLNGDGVVGFTDLVRLLSAWGPCV